MAHNRLTELNLVATAGNFMNDELAKSIILQKTSISLPY